MPFLAWHTHQLVAEQTNMMTSSHRQVVRKKGSKRALEYYERLALPA